MRVVMTDEFYERAEDAFKSVPKEELDQWSKHPATKALCYVLMGDLASHFDAWSRGKFTGPSAEETVQMNSKALGSVEAIESILSWIEDAPKGEMYDD